MYVFSISIYSSIYYSFIYILTTQSAIATLVPTLGKVSNFSKSLMEQKSCRLILEAMISKHIVNSTMLPSFLPGPNIWKISMQQLLSTLTLPLGICKG